MRRELHHFSRIAISRNPSITVAGRTKAVVAHLTPLLMFLSLFLFFVTSVPGNLSVF